MYILKPLIFI